MDLRVRWTVCELKQIDNNGTAIKLHRLQGFK